MFLLTLLGVFTATVMALILWRLTRIHIALLRVAAALETLLLHYPREHPPSERGTPWGV